MVFGLPGYMEVLAVSILLSFVSVMITRTFSDQKAVKALKSEMKTLNDRIKKAQKAGNQSEATKLSGDLMKISSKQFQMNMKPMFISLFIFLGVFWFFGMFYGELVVPSPVNIPFIGNQLGWFHWYFLIVLPGSFMWRKLLGVE